MHQIAVIGSGVVVKQRLAPLFRYFVAKFADILPTALASLIGGFLFTQYQAGYKPAPQPVAEQAAPASAEMLQLVRDEHAMILNYLKAQEAAEKSRNAAEDKDARALADLKPSAAPSTRRPLAVGASAVPVSAPTPKAPMTATAPVPVVRAPRVIAQTEQTDGAAPAADAARQSDSVLAKTLVIKDNVIHATLHAVSVIGGIPNWIASIGDRLGGAGTNAPPASRLVSTS